MRLARQREKRTPPNRDENNDADSTKDKFPARLHVLLAREAPVGVIFRRGPGHHVATLLWNRRTDQFQLGQWFKGQIFVRRSDLSPDGKHLIYFAAKSWKYSPNLTSWTAISRAPYLKALVMLPLGGTYLGGGLWIDNSSYWLNGGGGHSILRDDPAFQRDETYEPAMYTNHECHGVYYPRLLRDGWTLVAKVNDRPWPEDNWYKFEKPVRHGWILCKTAHQDCYGRPGTGCYWDTHELVHAAAGTSHSFPDWEWADVDRERLVWAQGGKLFAGQITKDGLSDTVELHDFNDMKFERIIAPY